MGAGPDGIGAGLAIVLWMERPQLRRPPPMLVSCDPCRPSPQGGEKHTRITAPRPRSPAVGEGGARWPTSSYLPLPCAGATAAAAAVDAVDSLAHGHRRWSRNLRPRTTSGSACSQESRRHLTLSTTAWRTSRCRWEERGERPMP